MPDDTCDEFPMAGHYQHGNMFGLTQWDCAEILPEWVGPPDYWVIWTYGTYSASQRCGIGHVPGNDNSSTGGAYGSFVQHKRVLDGERFYIGW